MHGLSLHEGNMLRAAELSVLWIHCILRDAEQVVKSLSIFALKAHLSKPARIGT